MLERQVTSLGEAEADARALVAYWAKRGGIVKAEVVAVRVKCERGSGLRDRITYSVRSDMVNGLPRAWAPPGTGRVAA